jgi:hypothetical protein
MGHANKEDARKEIKGWSLGMKRWGLASNEPLSQGDS